MSTQTVRGQLLVRGKTSLSGGMVVSGPRSTEPTEFKAMAGSQEYLVTSSDFFLSVDTSTSAATVQLPDAKPDTGRFVWIHDGKSNSGSNNIVIQNSDAQTITTMATNGEVYQMYSDGVSWWRLTNNTAVK